uniref:Uncharacterized protein n=1 Tax=Spironucleus salmonicida TaxID=348837 RepID=V6LR88_9EUKA|eukprot:EST43294.1 Hypothetical protein SS50377_16960 [Spironucleus salmonicida]
MMMKTSRTGTYFPPKYQSSKSLITMASPKLITQIAARHQSQKMEHLFIFSTDEESCYSEHPLSLIKFID